MPLAVSMWTRGVFSMPTSRAQENENSPVASPLEEVP